MYNNKTVLVTGGTGMLGSHLIELLLNEKANVRTIIHKRNLPEELKNKNLEIFEGDLTSKKFSKEVVKDVDYVFHLAAFTGGLGRTSSHPASTLTPNLIMDGNVLDSAKEENVSRFLYASCACIYPNSTKDLEEEDAWKGDPPQAHASYSWAKRMGELQALSYHKEYGMKIAIVRPSNSYGPRDNFDPESAHVIGALIIKATKNMNPFVIWGDGSPVREFIYAKDAAEGMLKTMETYCEADPINLSSGEYVTIGELAKKIIEIFKQNPKIIFDSTKPSGQKRRVLTGKKAEKTIGFSAKTSLDEGLKKAIKWYLHNQENRK